MTYEWMRVKGWNPSVADLPSFCADFKLAAANVDKSYGLIAEHQGAVVASYTAMISNTEIDRLKCDYPGQFEGPFSQAKFEPFGPPQV